MVSNDSESISPSYIFQQRKQDSHNTELFYKGLKLFFFSYAHMGQLCVVFNACNLKKQLISRQCAMLRSWTSDMSNSFCRNLINLFETT